MTKYTFNCGVKNPPLRVVAGDGLLPAVAVVRLSLLRQNVVEHARDVDVN